MTPTYRRSNITHLVLCQRILWDITASIYVVVTTPSEVLGVAVSLIFSRGHVVPCIGLEGLSLTVQCPVSLIQGIVSGLQSSRCRMRSRSYCILSCINGCFEGSFLSCCYITILLVLSFILSICGVAQCLSFIETLKQCPAVRSNCIQSISSILDILVEFSRNDACLISIPTLGNKSFQSSCSCLHVIVITRS